MKIYESKDDIVDYPEEAVWNNIRRSLNISVDNLVTWEVEQIVSDSIWNEIGTAIYIGLLRDLPNKVYD